MASGRMGSLELGLGSAVLLVGQFGDLVGDLLEPGCFGVEERVFDELQEEVGQSLPQSLQTLLGASSVEHVGLAVDEVHYFAGEVAVPLLDRPLGVQQDVQSLVRGDVLHLQSLVEVHQLLRADGEGRVHLGDTAVGVSN
jgi:hypothetical protein